MTQPTIGRVVHYVSQAHASVCRAAVVAEADDPAGVNVTLCVLNPTGIFFHTARRDDRLSSGTWHWPERD